MTGKRIVVVGGGSQFAAGLTESLIDYSRDMLAGSTVVLLDIRPEHLEVVYGYAAKLAAAVGADIRFERTTDRRAAFRGADYIINTFRPGSHLQQEQDETVPPKYGLQGNETVGIGGIFMACRVVPILKQICADAQELCPQAWFVNYTNPTQYVADAVRRISDLRFISLCDGYVEVGEDLGMLLGVDPGDITVYPAGSNHGMWIVNFTVKGEDGYPILRRRLSEVSQAEIDRLYAKPEIVDFIGLRVKPAEIYEQFIAHYSFPFSLKLFQIYGLLPAPRYYWRYHMDQDAVIAQERSGHYVTMAGFFMERAVGGLLGGLDERLARTSKHLQSSRRRGGGGHGDLAVRVIAAIENNLGEIFDVNVPNRGAVSNLPQEAILEVAATVDRRGPHPFAVGALPKALLGYQYSLVLAQELAVDAAFSGSRNDLLKAILAHPLIHTVDAAEKAMDELLALQVDWLPQFRIQAE
jgi:6-phospho-beta-glucosidase